MCRLTIWGPSSRVELAVPAHVPIADLMPTVLGHLDPALATTGMAHDGWVLQRLGEVPLDEDLGAAAAGLYDGDVLYLRPRDDQLPLADFDDLIDGVHTGLSARNDRWRPAFTRRACLVVAALCGLLAVFITTLAGTGTMIAGGAGGLSLLLLAAAAMLAKLAGERRGAAAVATVAVVAAGVAGLAMPSGGAPPEISGGPGVLTAGTAVAVAAVLARALLGSARPVFLALAAGGVLTALGGLLAVLAGLDAPATASVVMAVSLALTKLAPQLAAWLGGLSVEPVPTTPDEFQQGLDPFPSKDVLDRAALADVHLTAFLAVLGAVNTSALLVLAPVPRWDRSTLAGVTAVLLLLQAREFTGIWHRLSALVPAAASLVALTLGWSMALPLLGRLCVLVGLLALAGLGLAGAQMLPGRRLVPRWGRWGDILHWACALAIMPLVLAVTGLYGWASTWL
ncbi:type VII secretion integral membrane protein EccD [Amycolatopsis pigmentata]|uniref:Type VII secretion integral membrane protein EccD n=1 Tax=Amycolatopsis pigmentata TaxID=450801 RepID=A0ABW5G321_9PSEU